MTTILTASEAAELLGMRTDALFRLARRGDIPALRFGRSVRFELETLLVAAREAGSPQPRVRARRVAPVDRTRTQTPAARKSRANPEAPDPYAHLLQRR
jgi:excisionase family DNA binding protein